MRANFYGILAAVMMLSLISSAPTLGVEFDEELDRYFDTAPAPLSEAERQQLAQAQLKLDALREQLLKKSDGLTESQFGEIASKIEPLVLIVTRLERKQKQWEGAEGDLRPGRVPVAPDEPAKRPFDVNDFYRLQQDFLTLRIAEGRREAKGIEPASWRQLGARYRVFGNKKFTADQLQRGAYLLRARYMSSLCSFKGAVYAYEATGDRDEMMGTYRREIRNLQAIDRILKSAASSTGKAELLELLPVAPYPLTNIQLVGAESRFESDLRRRASREVGGPTAQVTTTKAVGRLLEAVCPWGTETFILLDEAGMTDGIEWSVVPPFAPKGDQKLSVSALNPAVIPKFIRQEMSDVRAGSFKYRGQTVNIDWAIIPDEASYSLWVTSPSVFEFSPAAMFTAASTAVTISQLGLLDIGVTLIGNGLNTAMADSYGADCPVTVAVGVAPDALMHKLDTKTWEFKRAGVSRLGLAGKLATGIATQALAVVEEMELRALFEDYRPASDSAKAFVGNPLTYLGNPVPPVLMRAFIVGIENVPDDEYRRVWIVTKYWQFDPRALSATVHGRYDLTKQRKSSDPGIKAYLAGDAVMRKAVWKPLPDTPESPIGTRLAVTDLTPRAHSIRIELPQDVWKKWTKDLSPDRVLLAVADSRKAKPDELVGEFKDGWTRIRLHTGDRPPVIGVGISGIWYPAELLTEYPIRIVEADKRPVWQGNQAEITYNLDPTVSTEKGRCVARFRGTRGLRPNGKLMVIGQGNHTVTEWHHLYRAQTTDSTNTAVAEIDGDLLPKAVTLKGHFSLKEGDALKVGYGRDHVGIAGAAAPAALGWHRFKIVVDGRHTFHAHGLCESPGGGAPFVAQVPVSPGRHTIVVSCDGFESATVAVDREPPRHNDLDVNAEMASIREYQINRNSESSGSRRYWDYHFDMVHRKIGLARDLGKVERFVQARALLQEVGREIPRQQLNNAYAEKDRKDVHNALMHTLPDICYWLGDVKTMAQARKWVLDKKIAERIEDIRTDDDPPRWLLGEADDLATFIEKCILLDADSVMGSGYIASLDALHQNLLKRAGVYDPRVDSKYMFRYGQEIAQ